ncbi:MAG TPA: histidine kinase [Firmicutes bacterium]|nr:histidine kinase [Bacillota bacterium]
MDPQGIDRIFQQAVAALSESRAQIYSIAEAAQTEYQRLQLQYEEIRREAADCIKEVDQLDRQLRQAKRRLAVVNRDFDRYSEEEIKEAYEETHNLQIMLAVAQEREAALRRKRDELERSLRNLAQLVAKAKHMAKHMGAAMSVLVGNLEEALEAIDSLQERSILATKIIQAQEDERLRVARDIHDGPAQAMANVVLRAEICERLLDGDRNELARELIQLKNMVKEALVDVRRIIFDLRPMALDDLGLVPTVRRFIEAVKENTDIPIELVVLGQERRLAGAVEVAIFRLIQEAVNNAQKHSQASRILVKLEFADGQVNMQVRDDGIGFDVEEVRQKAKYGNHYGLMSMGERVNLLGGELKVFSTRGQGTTILVSIPIDSEESQAKQRRVEVEADTGTDSR